MQLYLRFFEMRVESGLTLKEAAGRLLCATFEEISKNIFEHFADFSTSDIKRYGKLFLIIQVGQF